MARTIFSIIAGLIAATLVIAGFTILGRLGFPPAVGGGVPPAAFGAIVIGYAVGSLAGGWLTARLAASGEWWPPLTVGALLSLGTANFVLMFPHPTWFVTAVLILPLPLAWAGHYLRLRRGG